MTDWKSYKLCTIVDGDGGHITLEQVYQSFKERFASECTLNLWPNEETPITKDVKSD